MKTRELLTDINFQDAENNSLSRNERNLSISSCLYPQISRRVKRREALIGTSRNNKPSASKLIRRIALESCSTSENVVAERRHTRSSTRDQRPLQCKYNAQCTQDKPYYAFPFHAIFFLIAFACCGMITLVQQRGGINYKRLIRDLIRQTRPVERTKITWTLCLMTY